MSDSKRFGVTGSNVFTSETTLSETAEAVRDGILRLKDADPKVIHWLVTGEWPDRKTKNIGQESGGDRGE